MGVWERAVKGGQRHAVASCFVQNKENYPAMASMDESTESTASTVEGKVREAVCCTGTEESRGEGGGEYSYISLPRGAVA